MASVEHEDYLHSTSIESGAVWIERSNAWRTHTSMKLPCLRPLVFTIFPARTAWSSACKCAASRYARSRQDEGSDFSTTAASPVAAS